jgi:UDP-N-acetylmuramoylalanine--D-glutamate ligase
MELRGRKTLVLGAGRSGVEASKFLAERGAIVALHDKLPVADWTAAARSLKGSYEVGFLTGQIPSWLLDQIGLVVISPGVPTSSIPARYVDRRDGEVIGEIELAYRFLKGRVVGITGSNGKTTTTTLIGEILTQAGLPTQVGGNIGTPLLSLVDSSQAEGVAVVELSSFQLESIREFRCNVAVCLNVTPNHLDRYDSFQDYAAAKHRIFLNQTPDDVAVLNADDEITASWIRGLAAKLLLFSVRSEPTEGVFLRGNEIVLRIAGDESVLLDRREILLKGLHNVENIAAASAAAVACGVSIESIRSTITSFKGVEHRLEFVTEIEGVSYYNDSKATSVDATCKALEALTNGPGKTVLILGGRGKSAPYSPLIPLIRERVREVIVFGEDSENITSQLSGSAAIALANSIQDAVERAHAIARAGDSVLLAPACASFDMFRNFEERGHSFKAAVMSLSRSAMGTNSDG